MLFCHWLKPQLAEFQPALAMKIMADEWKTLWNKKRSLYKEIVRKNKINQQDPNSGQLLIDKNKENYKYSCALINESKDSQEGKFVKAINNPDIEIIEIDNDEEELNEDDIEDTAFMIYWEEMERLARQNHDFIVMDELLEQISQKWNQMSTFEKNCYFNAAYKRIEDGETNDEIIKKPILPFFAFANKIRKEIKQHNPKASSKEISCAVSLAWSRVTKEEKSRLQTQYFIEKQIYQNLTNQSKNRNPLQAAYSKTFDNTSSNKVLNISQADPMN